jgi:large subunit ribosomal protein L10
MPSQRNVHALAEVNKEIKSAKAIILANYSGLSVANQGALRKKLAEVGGKFSVFKNNIIKLALKENHGLSRDVEDVLREPTALIIATQDAVTTTKALTDFIKDKELPQIKIGIMDGNVLNLAQIDALSKLPSKNVLLSSLLAQLNAPIQALVRQINAPAQRLVYALEAIRNK